MLHPLVEAVPQQRVPMGDHPSEIRGGAHLPVDSFVWYVVRLLGGGRFDLLGKNLSLEVRERVVGATFHL